MPSIIVAPSHCNVEFRLTTFFPGLTHPIQNSVSGPKSGGFVIHEPHHIRIWNRVLRCPLDSRSQEISRSLHQRQFHQGDVPGDINCLPTHEPVLEVVTPSIRSWWGPLLVRWGGRGVPPNLPAFLRQTLQMVNLVTKINEINSSFVFPHTVPVFRTNRSERGYLVSKRNLETWCCGDLQAKVGRVYLQKLLSSKLGSTIEILSNVERYCTWLISFWRFLWLYLD